MLDISGFVGPWPYWPVAHSSAESVLSLMDRHHIDSLAICSTASIFWDWRQGNEEAIALAERHPSRFIAFISVSPILPAAPLIDLLRDYKRRKVRGIRLYPQHHSYSLTESTVIAEVLKAAQDMELPVLLPLRTIMNWGLAQLDEGAITTTVARYPNLHFILSGVNYNSTLWAYELMRAHSNTYLEISALQRFRAVDAAVKAVGASRILFGSGLPFMYPACSLAKMRVANIGESQKLAIGEGNARSLLQI